MAWISPTTTALITEGKLMDAEYARLSTVQLADGSTAEEVLDLTKARVIASMRGYIGVKCSGRMGEPGTLPDELYDAFLSLWVVQFLGRLGAAGKPFISDTRRADAEAATKLLERVANGTFALSLPAEISTETPTSGNSGAELIAAPRRPL